MTRVAGDALDEALYDGASGRELAAVLDLPRVEVRDRLSSTLDLAHDLAAASAPAGTLVLADEQTAGRGRGGRSWVSGRGAGLWLTLLERPADESAVEVLSIRVGIRAARVLDRYAPAPVSLKWPNDLLVEGGKLAGVLLESRWREARIEWVAIGLGVNVRAPSGVEGAASLLPDTSRIELLGELIPAVRAAAAARGALATSELDEYASRDRWRGRACALPSPGTVEGIDASGALLVRSGRGLVRCRSGSLVLDDGRTL
ncbi:MAG: biotin--[acetyl-CoA-carboxylase] ligase [Gemmatimonadaceae bacterium]